MEFKVICFIVVNVQFRSTIERQRLTYDASTAVASLMSEWGGSGEEPVITLESIESFMVKVSWHRTFDYNLKVVSATTARPVTGTSGLHEITDE